MTEANDQEIEITLAGTGHKAILNTPPNTQGIVLFVHGSGSSRNSPRNRYVASVLNEAGVATLLFDLLTEEEDQVYETRFDIELLTRRLSEVTEWITQQENLRQLAIGYFGASTGAAAALKAAAARGTSIKAIVSRGGRPDLAAQEYLSHVQAPTLLMVGGLDDGVIDFNQLAYNRLQCIKDLQIIPGATHLFEEPGTLEQVAQLACNWFVKYLTRGKSE